MNTIREIEDGMADILIEYPEYHKIVGEYHRMRSIMGNLDSDEIVSLIILSMRNCEVI